MNRPKMRRYGSGVATLATMMLVAIGPLAGRAQAVFVTYQAMDLGAGPTSPRPNSDAAAAMFDAAAAALGPASTITFESAPAGTFRNLAIAPGVTINGTDLGGLDQSIGTAPFPSNPSLNGFNTTAGGTRYVNMLGGNLVFTFAQPTRFFGAFLTGVQTNFFADRITASFTDGTTETIFVPGAGTSGSVGAVAFVGFIDTTRLASSVTVSAGNPGTPLPGADNIGVDDVRVQSLAIPEPSSLALCGMALLAGLGVLGRRRRVRPAIV